MIVDTAAVTKPLAFLDAVLAGGVRLVQLRAKRGVDRRLLDELVKRMHAAGGALVVNDDLDAALAADGWHAGQEDLAGRDLAKVRRRLGSRLFGVSCGVPDEARRAEAYGADYVGAGPFATTGSKGDAGPAIGPSGVAAVVRATRLPVAAIGGIGESALAEVAATGAAMAAVISAPARARDPERATAALVARWHEVAR